MYKLHRGRNAMNARLNLCKGLFAFILVFSFQGWAIGADMTDHATPAGSDSQNASDPSWQTKLKDQIAREDSMEGRAGHADRVDSAMQKLMGEISKGSGQHATGGGQDRKSVV